MQTQSRQAFLRASGLVVAGSAAGGFLAACAAPTSSLVSGVGAKSALAPNTFDRTAKYTYTWTTLKSDQRNRSIVQPICGADAPCGGSGGGDLGGYTGVTYTKATASDGNWADTSETSTTTYVVNGSSSAYSNLTISQPTSTPVVGATYTSTVSNGASITRTIANDYSTVNGQFVDLHGQTWTLNMVFTDTQVTVNYSGPQSGTIVVNLSDLAYSAHGRTVQGCSKTNKEGAARLGSAFDVASLWLLGLGLAPASVVTAVIGAGLGVYSTFC